MAEILEGRATACLHVYLGWHLLAEVLAISLYACTAGTHGSIYFGFGLF
jgi:hypothetical protein